MASNLPLRRSEPFLLPVTSSPHRDQSKERTWSDSRCLPSATTQTSTTSDLKTFSDKRVLYRKWRTGSHRGASLSIIETHPTISTEPAIITEASTLSLSVDPQSSSHPPTEPSVSSPLSVDMLPDDLVHSAATASSSSSSLNKDELERRARLLSDLFLDDDASSTFEALSGSFGKGSMSSTKSIADSIKKSKSYQFLSDLEKTQAIHPTKSSASGVQRGLKDSVMHDMCHAVVKQMVGDVSGSHPNHLYEPVFASVQNHFKQLPARYALSVDPDDVPMHMRLLANQKRAPDDIYLHAHLLKDEDGTLNTNLCEVVLVAQDRDSLLDAITRGLSSLKGSIMDADVMTTREGVTLDRFVVKGSFVAPDRLAELKRRIVDNLERSALAAENSDKQRAAMAAGASSTAQPAAPPAPAASNPAQQSDGIKPEWRVAFSELHLGEAVGNGRSGQTYSGIWRGTRVAVKVINVSHHNQTVSQEILGEFHREVAVVSRLRHPNIVLFLGASIDPPKYCLVFEYMENGALTDLIRQRRAPIDFFRIAREIAMGMNYLHLCSIMHRDLKSANVLLDAFGTVKISDFGLSCVLEAGNAADLTAETGTYRWMAPEVIGHEPYSGKADVYSYGVILWELIAKDQPFKGMTPIQAAFAVARQHLRPAFPEHTPECLRTFVNLCWAQKPHDRPTFAVVLDMLPKVQAQMRKLDLHKLNFVSR
ncbi:hypothetical protein AeMF1_021518 [Aphanomyces euteiches]|nr:hypothetical protein AeMF1_021518 [Aphanomyces euteiches]KAH9197692.1 hypothetical protein AeNC1_000336 [Aphanomyces euteiches]